MDENVDRWANPLSALKQDKCWIRAKGAFALNESFRRENKSKRATPLECGAIPPLSFSVENAMSRRILSSARLELQARRPKTKAPE